MVKILNLNLWNYTEWESRKSKIIDFIRKQNPEVVCLQEVRDDIRFNKRGENQAIQLNKQLRYAYYAFYKTTDKRKERPEKYDKYCIEGMAILSKFPIIKVEGIPLKKQPKDIYNCGSLYARIKAEKTFDLMNVHFSNSDLFSLLHLIETMKQINERRITPIIAGDFNMWHSEWLKDLISPDYQSSMDFKRYRSYPSQKWTLDYIVIPKKYKFRSLKCLGNISDHRALIADIKL